jgi:hypothetical protein
MLLKKQLPPTFGEKPNYSVGKMKDYDGPDIDWSGFNQQFMSAQLAKSVGFFSYLDKKIDAMHDDIIKKWDQAKTCSSDEMNTFSSDVNDTEPINAFFK